MESESSKKETIYDIALKIAKTELQDPRADKGPKERTVFVLGSNRVGKTTAINSFFDREDAAKPTLALEYSYGRRNGNFQKQVLNVWELGSLENSEQLIKFPLKNHGILNFAAVIMVDLSRPQTLWADLEMTHRGLKTASEEIIANLTEDVVADLYAKAKERVKTDHIDMSTLDLMPFPLVIVGAKYDVFMSYEPELKKHVCRCLRSMAHLTGASLLFYSNKIQKLTKILRDTINHLGFGSPLNPFRAHNIDYNDALSIWFGNDSWEKITSSEAQNIESIQTYFTKAVPQLEEDKTILNDPGKDPAFRESVIDEMRAIKDKELEAIMKDLQIRSHFESTSK